MKNYLKLKSLKKLISYFTHEDGEDECEKAVYKLQGVVSKGDSLEKICAENNAVAKKCTSAELLLLLFSLRASDQDAIAKAIGQCS